MLRIENLAEAVDALAAQTAHRARAAYWDQVLHLLQRLESAQLAERINRVKDRIPWLVARPTAEPPGARYPAPPSPRDYVAVATDGSHMAPDRHSPVRFLVLNIGKARIRYGAHPRAFLSSAGTFLYREEDLSLRDDKGNVYPIEGAVLGIVMALEELRALVQEADEEEIPVMALRDGSLIFWPLQSEETPLQDTLLPQITRALRQFHDMGVPVASYISYPGARDVVNSVRVWLCGSCVRRGTCEGCEECTAAEAELCTWLRPMRDRELFAAYLNPGERSAIFESSSALQTRYRDPWGMDHRIQFFYLHTGKEIARVEAPIWVMQNPRYRDRIHGLLVDQCRRGGGYPPVLQEAHEQAVITVEDRRMVETLVEQALAREGIAYVRSRKDWSKRVRGV